VNPRLTHPGARRSRGSGSSTLVVLLVLLALAAGGYWLYSTGRIFGDAAGTPAGPKSAPAAGAQNRPAVPGNVPPGGSGADAPDLGGTLFDMDDAGAPRGAGSGSNPLAERAAARAAEADRRQARVAAAEAAVAAARTKLEQARATISNVARVPAVAKARAEVEAAEADVKRLRAAGAGGSSEMLAAGKRNLEAKANLRKALDTAAQSDPGVAAAHAELKRAEAELRAARGPKQ
jgi:hypothetical protein